LRPLALVNLVWCHAGAREPRVPHTTRAALTGLKKKGYAISSDKVDGVRTYRGIAPE
jgi:hypothetical protein